MLEAASLGAGGCKPRCTDLFQVRHTGLHSPSPPPLTGASSRAAATRTPRASAAPLCTSWLQTRPRLPPTTPAATRGRRRRRPWWASCRDAPPAAHPAYRRRCCRYVKSLAALAALTLVYSPRRACGRLGEYLPHYFSTRILHGTDSTLLRRRCSSTRSTSRIVTTSTARRGGG